MSTTLLFVSVWGAVFFEASTAAEPSGSGTWWTIVSAMGTFIGLQFAYIKKQGDELKSCRDSQIKKLEDKLAMVRAVKKSVQGSKIVKPPTDQSTGDLSGS
jgi:hypothetical protein